MLSQKCFRCLPVSVVTSALAVIMSCDIHRAEADPAAGSPQGPIFWHGTQRQTGAGQVTQGGIVTGAQPQFSAPGMFRAPSYGRPASPGFTGQYPYAANQIPPAQKQLNSAYSQVQGSPPNGQLQGAQQWGKQRPAQATDDQANDQRVSSQQRRRDDQQSPRFDPWGYPIPTAQSQRFFNRLQGPHISTWNQNRNNYSFRNQRMPSTRIHGVTWQQGSRFGQNRIGQSFHNQSRANQNTCNYSLRGISTPGMRGWR